MTEKLEKYSSFQKRFYIPKFTAEDLIILKALGTDKFYSIQEVTDIADEQLKKIGIEANFKKEFHQRNPSRIFAKLEKMRLLEIQKQNTRNYGYKATPFAGKLIAWAYEWRKNVLNEKAWKDAVTVNKATKFLEPIIKEKQAEATA